VGLRAGLDIEVEEKSFAPAGDRTPIARSSSPQSDTVLSYPAPELTTPHFNSNDANTSSVARELSLFVGYFKSPIINKKLH
jgi:hypothetical protein